MDPVTLIKYGIQAGRFIGGVVQGVKRVMARKYPTVDETMAQWERERAEQKARYEELQAAAKARKSGT